MKTIVGIDNGTQSTKVIFYDYENRRVAATGRSPHTLISGKNGRREQKAKWWIEALQDAISQVEPEIRKTAEAIGVSGQQHGFVPLDKDGLPIYNVKLWNDTETSQECTEITDAYGGTEKLIKNAGNPVLPGFTAGKILWLKKNRPDQYSRLAHILLPHDYINFYLTGKYFTDPGDASGTAYFNIYNKKWEESVLEAIDPNTDLLSKLPPVIRNSETGGRVSTVTANKLGLPEGIPVSSGGGDNMMGAIGTGAISEGIVTVSLGTSGTIFSYRDQAMVDPKERLSAFCSSNDGWLPLLCTMNCNVAVDQFRKLFDKTVSEVDSLVGSTSPGSEGLLTLPFFNGERTPNLPHGKGCLCGMNVENLSEGNILRSAMESAAYGLKTGLEAFQEQGLTPKTVHLIGGGSNSSVWRHIIADILEIPIQCPHTEEASAFGAALQALWASNSENTSLEEIVKSHIHYDQSRYTSPNSENREVYRNGYKEYLNYIEHLTPLFK